jgi:hypothetical protein
VENEKIIQKNVKIATNLLKDRTCHNCNHQYLECYGKDSNTCAKWEELDFASNSIKFVADKISKSIGQTIVNAVQPKKLQ